MNRQNKILSLLCAAVALCAANARAQTLPGTLLVPVVDYRDQAGWHAHETPATNVKRYRWDTRPNDRLVMVVKDLTTGAVSLVPTRGQAVVSSLPLGQGKALALFLYRLP